jgi:cell division protein DivIC
MIRSPHIRRALPFVKNKFLITIALFLVWMLFFDQYNLVARVSNKRKIANLEQQKEIYVEEIARSKRLLQELKGDDESLEKFAREQYLMKKDNEDVYLVKK